MRHTKNMFYRESVESRELFLYATNDGELYRQMITPIIDNMKRKVKNGIYDKEKAIDAWYTVATEASAHYYRDFSYKFSVTDRYTVAVDMASYYEDEIFYNSKNSTERV